jgi:hypothetical protein
MNRNYFIYLGLSLALALIVFRIVKNNVVHLKSSSKQEITQETIKPLHNFYQQWLDEEEKNLWQAIETTYNISKEDCKLFGADIQEPAVEHYNFSPETKNLIATVLADFGIEKATIIGSNPNSTTATSYRSTVCVNEKKLLRHSIVGQKYIIAHELQHLHNQDAIIGTALEVLLEKKGLSKSNDPKHPANKMSRFFELRADIQTAIHSPDYAQGLFQAMNIFKKNGINLGISHPKIALRQQVAKNIMKAHTLVAERQALLLS